MDLNFVSFLFTRYLSKQEQKERNKSTPFGKSCTDKKGKPTYVSLVVVASGERQFGTRA
jgi:hypothetical protein